jgi:cytochrome c
MTVQARVQAAPVEIQLPAETGAFKQDAGAEIANGQCLTCHSVEYVSTQPPMPRNFWKASVQKMQQKYGAPVPDEQVESLVDYLARNYGVSTNATSGSGTAHAEQGAFTSGKPGGVSITATQIATKYGCLGCHNASVKIVGPAYKEIAAKYKNDAQAENKIAEQIHKGGSGKWGPIIMPPFPQVTAEETKALTEWILALGR